MKGIKSGDYTHDDYVNVYTEGLGFQGDPLVAHYRFIAGSSLLLIDGNGNIASRLVPGMDSEKLRTSIRTALRTLVN